MAGFASRTLRRRYGISEIEIREQATLAELLRQGHGILLAPNHCRMSDPMALQSLSRALRQPFFIMASSHLFRGSRLTRFILRRIGAFSVYHEGVDRQAVDTPVRRRAPARSQGQQRNDPASPAHAAPASD